MGDELGATVGDNVKWNTMEVEDMIDQEISRQDGMGLVGDSSEEYWWERASGLTFLEPVW